MGIGWGTAYHHTDNLVKAGRVKVFEDPPHTRLFTSAIGEERCGPIAATVSPVARAVVDLIKEQGPLQQFELLHLCNGNRKLIQPVIRRLKEQEVLVKRGSNRAKYELGPKVDYILAEDEAWFPTREKFQDISHHLKP